MFRKLSKRFLPILLSVAMLVTNIPQTAFAAEVTASEIETVETAVPVEDEVAAEVDGEAVVSAEAVEAEEITTAAAKDGTIIIHWDDSDFTESYSWNDVHYDSVTGTFYATYVGPETRVFDNFVENVIKNRISLEYPDEPRYSVDDKINYQWQEKAADGTFKDIVAPITAGVYKLVVSLPSDLVQANTVELNFEVKQSVLAIGLANTVTIVNGSTVDAAIEEIKKNIAVYKNGALVENKDQYIKNLTVLVKKAGDEDAKKLAGTTQLYKTEDYTFVVNAEAQDAVNFIVKNYTDKVAFAGEKLTYIAINWPTDQTVIKRSFTGSEVAAPKNGTEYTYTVTEIVDGKEVPVEVKVSEIAEKWYTATELTEFSFEKEVEIEAPVNAGKYYYVIMYEDADGVYAKSLNAIPVVIEPVTVNMKIEVDSEAVFYAEMLRSNVLQAVDYKLLTANGSEYEFDRSTFWGVHFVETDAFSYEPVFELQKKVVEVVEGKESTILDWTQVASGEKLMVSDVIGENNQKVSYRIIFTGQKAYYKSGNAYGVADANATGTNSAEKNYVVDVNDLEKTAVAVKVLPPANATIDVTNVLLDKKGATIDDRYKKIYDGAPLYIDREEYKKAVVLNGKEEICANTASELTYKWYSITLEDVPELDKDGNPVKDANGKEVTKKQVASKTTISTDYDKLPYRAGLYMLQISYKDPAKKYFAEDAFVYFEIEKQLVKVVMTGEVTAMSDTTISAWNLVIENQKKGFDFDIYRVPGNDLTKPLTDADKLNWSKDWEDLYYRYEHPYIQWNVTYALDISDPDTKYELVEEYYELYDANKKYRLNVELNPDVLQDWIYDDYDCYTNVVYNEKNVAKYVNDPVDIKVDQMGEIPIQIEFDQDVLKTIETEKVYDGKGFDITPYLEKGLVKVTNLQTGAIIDLKAEGAPQLTYNWYGAECGDYYYDAEDKEWYRQPAYANGEVSPANAGRYELSAYFFGDSKYKDAVCGQSLEFEIKKRELTVTPVLQENIYAGSKATISSYLNINNVVEVTGYLEEDKYCFENIHNYSDDYWCPIAFSNVNAKTYKDGSVYSSYAYLRTGVEYKTAVSLTWNGNYYYYNWDGYRLYNYDLVYKTVTFKTNKRSASRIFDPNVSPYKHNVVYDVNSHEVIAIGAIPYTYSGNMTDMNGKDLYGNYFTFMIAIPDEFREAYDYLPYRVRNSFSYKNNIEKAGGYIIDDATNYIEVAFDVTETKTYEFSIVWEEGFVETFKVDCSASDLFPNLHEAVAPKSLKFNAVNSKMIIGDTQQLDVVLKKVQNTDIVDLRYRIVSGDDVISLTDYGFVTALKTGSAVVEVYPVKINEKGELEEIPFKAASAKINVSDVTPVKIKTINVWDYDALVEYTIPNNGFRREFYWMAGENIPAATFEEKIAEMKFGTVPGLGYAYVDDTPVVDPKKKFDRYYSIYGLSPNTTYTLYIRNVSGFKTMADDSFQVASFAGITKSFTTTKVQLTGIDIEFDCFKNEEDPVAYYVKEHGRYEAKLSSKNMDLVTLGKYIRKPAQDAADKSDIYWLDLPLEAEYADAYLAPKLTYYCFDIRHNYDWIAYDPEKKIPAGYIRVDDKLYRQSKIATVDKLGKVTFKGVGSVVFCIYDSNSGEYAFTQKLHIISDVTSISIKNIKLNVAQCVDVYDYITYMSDRTRLSTQGYNAADVYPIGLRFKDPGEDSWKAVSYTEDGTIRACGDKRSVVMEAYLLENPEVSTEFIVTTGELPAVKGLKAVDVYDNYVVIDFTDTVLPLSFLVDVKDSKGQLVSSEYVYPSNILKPEQDGKVYAFRYSIGNLNRISNYTISVTPVDGSYDVLGKKASCKVKTTAVPASYVSNLDKDNEKIGGMSIQIVNTARTHYIGSAGYLTSGNIFTLMARSTSIDNGTCADTLTWTSSNKKVATVKAKGSYTAELKTLKPGTTFIAVSSKLTKHVIARWVVNVKGVASAETSFNDYDFFERTLDLNQINGVELLTEQNPVKTKGGRTYVKFVAPKDGSYSFSGDLFNYYAISLDNKADWNYIDDLNNVSLIEGQEIYLMTYETTTVTVSGVHYEAAELGKEFQAANKARTVLFTAPKDGVYAVFSIANGKKSLMSGYPKKLSANEIVAFNVNARCSAIVERLSAFTAKAPAGMTVAVGQTGYTYFTASEYGEYKFTRTADSAKTKMSYRILDSNSGQWTFAKEADKDALVLTLRPEQIVVFTVQNTGGENITPTISVTEPGKVGLNTNGENSTIELKKDSYSYASFVVTDNETSYVVDASGIKKDEVPAVQADSDTTPKPVPVDVYLVAYDGNGNVITSGYNQITISGNQVEKGEKITVKISISDVAATVKVAVNSLNAVVLTDGQLQNVDLTKKQSTIYSFTAPQYGKYRFESVTTNDVAECNVSAWVINSLKDNNTIDTFNWVDDRSCDRYYEVILEAGETVLTAVSVEGTPGTEKDKETKIAYGVTRITAAELTDAKEMKTKAGLKGSIEYFKYNAAEDGVFSFTIKKARNLDISTSTSLNSNSWSTYVNTYNLKKGESIFFKVVNRDGVVGEKEEETDGKFTITVKNDSLNELPDGNLAVKKEAETNTYNYTVKEAGRYTVRITASEKVNATVQINNRTYADGDEIVFYYVGQVQKVMVTTSAEEENGTLGIKLEKVTAKALPDAETTIKAGTKEWFEFKVATAGRYHFETYIQKDAETKEELSPRATTNLGKSYLESLENYEERWLEQGTILYILVENTKESDIKAVLKATRIVGKDLSAAGTDIALEKNSSEWYQYTIPEKGHYEFIASDEKLNLDYYYDNTNNYRDYGIDVYEYAAGTVLLLKVSNHNTEKVEGKIRIAAVDIVTLEPEKEIKITLAQGETRYVKYMFPNNGKTEIQVTYKEEDGILFDNLWVEKNYAVIEGSQADNYLFSMTLPGVSDDATEEAKKATSEVTLKASVIKVHELEDELKAELNNGRKWYYSFTAPEKGWYYITADAETKDIKLINVVSCNSAKKAIFFEEGEKVEGYLSFTDDKQTATATAVLKVQKVTPAVLSQDKVEVDLAANESEWYSYTPNTTGAYLFECLGRNIQIFEDMTTGYGSSDFASVDKVVFAGKTIYVRVANYDSDAGKKELKVQKLDTIPLTVDEIAKDEEVSADDVQYFYMRVQKTGYYSFRATRDLNSISDYDDSMTVQTNKEQKSSSFGNGTAATMSNVKLEAGQEILVRLKEVVECNYSLTVSLEKEIAADFDLTLTDTKYHLVTYQVPATGRYTLMVENFSADNSRVYYAYDGKSFVDDGNYPGNSDGSLNQGDSRDLTLSAGETLYLKLYNYNASANSEKRVVLSILKAANVELISTKNTSSDMEYTSFTAKESGQYTFSNISNKYAYVYYYGEDPNCASRNSTIYQGNSSSQYLVAGTTVYFATYYSSASEENPVNVYIQVSCEKMDDVFAVIAKSNTSESIEYTVPKTGRYSFTYVGDTYVNYSGTLYYYGTDKTGEYLKQTSRGNFLSAGILEAGTKVYFKASHNATDNDKTVTLMVKASCEDLGDVLKVTANDSNEKELSFTAEETGDYTFTNYTNGWSNYIYYIGTNKDAVARSSSINGNDGSMTLTLPAGTTVYFKTRGNVATATNPITFYLGYKKAKNNDFTLVTVQNTNEEGKKYTAIEFTASETAKYTFSNVSCYDSTVYYYGTTKVENSDEAGAAKSSIGRNGSYSKVLEAGETVYFHTYASSATTEKPIATWLKITASSEFVSYEHTTLNIGDVKDLGFETGTVGYYVFEAPKDSVYRFSIVDTVCPDDYYGWQSQFRLYIYRDKYHEEYANNNESRQDFYLELTMKAGEKVYLSANHGFVDSDYNTLPASAKITVEDKFTDLSLDSSKEFAVKQEYRYFKFTAAEAGVYQVSADNFSAVQHTESDSFNVSMYLYRNANLYYSDRITDGSVYDLNGSIIKFVKLSAGESVYISLYGYVQYQDGEDWKVDEAGGNVTVSKAVVTKSEENTKDTYKEVPFKVSETGEYTFYNLNNKASVYYYGTDKDGSYLTSISSNGTTLTLKADTVCYFKTKLNYSDADPVVEIARVKRDTVITELIEQELTSSSKYQVVTFTAPAFAKYTFTNVSPCSKSTMYFYGKTEVTGSDYISTDYNGEFNTSYTRTLEAGEKVYFKVQNRNASTDQKKKFWIKVTKSDDVQTYEYTSLKLDEENTLTAKSADTSDYVYYSFTAEEDGVYSFRSPQITDEEITYAYGYLNFYSDQYLEERISYNSIYRNDNLSDERSLKAGESVYIQFSGYETHSFTDELGIATSEDKPLNRKLIIKNKFAKVELNQEVDVETSYNVQFYSVFQAPEEGAYSISMSNLSVAEGIEVNYISSASIYLSNTDKLNPSIDNASISNMDGSAIAICYLEKDQKVYIQQAGYVSAKNAEDNTNFYTALHSKLKVEKANAIVETLTDTDTKTIEFTVPESAVYNFKNLSDDTVNYYGLSTENSLTSIYKNGTEQLVLPSGAKVFFKVTASDASEETPKKVLLLYSKSAVDEVLATTNTNVTGSMYQVVEFKAEKTAKYTFTNVSPYSNKYAARVYCYGRTKTTTDDTNSGYIKELYIDNPWTKTLEEGDKVYFKTWVYPSYASAEKPGQVWIKVESDEKVADYQFVALEENKTNALKLPYTNESAYEAINYYSFQAPTAGYYSFATDEIKAPEGSTTTNVYLTPYSDKFLEEREAELGCYANNLLTSKHYLEADQKIYFKIQAVVSWADSTATKPEAYTCNLSVKKLSEISVTLTDSDRVYEKFTVPEDGIYRFHRVNDRTSIYYYGLEKNEDGTIISGTIDLTLAKDAEIWFTVQNASATAENPKTVTLYYEKLNYDYVKVLTTENTSGEQYVMVSFTAPETAQYTFRNASNGNAANNGYVYYYGDKAVKTGNTYDEVQYVGQLHNTYSLLTRNMVKDETVYFKTNCGLASKENPLTTWIEVKRTGDAPVLPESDKIEAGDKSITLTYDEDNQSIAQNFVFEAPSKGKYTVNVEGYTVPESCEKSKVEVFRYSDIFFDEKTDTDAIYQETGCNFEVEMDKGDKLFLSFKGEAYGYKFDGEDYIGIEYYTIPLTFNIAEAVTSEEPIE